MSHCPGCGRTDMAGITHVCPPPPATLPMPVKQMCPICLGKGRVQHGFYDFPGVEVIPATSTEPEMCRSCGGRGIV